MELSKQDENQASNTRKFTKEDGEIDWKKSLEEIDRQIRAFNPWPGSYTTVDNKRLIIYQAHVEDEKLALDVVQQEGKKPMKFSEFLRGHKGQRPGWFEKIKN